MTQTEELTSKEVSEAGLYPSVSKNSEQIADIFAEKMQRDIDIDEHQIAQLEAITAQLPIM